MIHHDPHKAPLLPPVAVLMIGAVVAWQLWGRPRGPQGWIVQHDTGDPALLAFELGGHVGQPQIRAMARAVLTGFDRFDQVDMLVVLPSFTGLTPGGALDLKGMKAGLLSLGKVRRYAVVAPPAVADAMIALGDRIFPVNARTFPLAELSQARAWATAGR